MDTDAFFSAFDKIDADGDGVIDYRDLEIYSQVETVQPDFVKRYRRITTRLYISALLTKQKWISLFDPDGNGRITYEDFCTTLGMTKKRRETNKSPLVYQSNMMTSEQDQVLQILKSNWNSQDPEGSTRTGVRELKRTLGSDWHSDSFKDPTFLRPRGEYVAYSFNDGENKQLVWRDNKRNKCCSCC